MSLQVECIGVRREHELNSPDRTFPAGGLVICRKDRFLCRRNKAISVTNYCEKSAIEGLSRAPATITIESEQWYAKVSNKYSE